MKSTVILCTRNRLNETIRFTKSLYNQKELPYEYIIVDSSDIKLSKNADFKDEVLLNNNKIIIKYIHSLPGLTHQRNIGVKESTGKIIYFFDDDIILEEDYLAIMNETFRLYPEYYGGMGTFVNLNKPGFRGKINLIKRSLFLLQRDFGDGKFRVSGFPQHPYGNDNFMNVEVLGGCCCYKKVIFNEFSFDENMTGYSSQEDVDFSRRVSYKYKLFFNPKAKCEHRHALGGRGSIIENKKMYMVNFRYTFFKNFFSKNKCNIIAHWWAIIGLFINSKNIRQIIGYLTGLVEFSKRKKELLN